MNILIIEDDLFLSLNIKKVFEKKILSNRIKIINSFDKFLNELWIIDSYDIVLIDILLKWKSNKNWINILEIIRRKKLFIPLVIISWLNSIERLEKAFDNWANDYIIKPFRLKELEIRIFKWFTIYFHTYNLNNKCKLQYNWLTYNLLKNEFDYKKKEINLSKNNKYLLSIFLKNKEEIISRKILISKIWWDLDYTINRNLRIKILRLKRRLKPFWIDDWIICVRWEWYIFRKN